MPTLLLFRAQHEPRRLPVHGGGREAGRPISLAGLDVRVNNAGIGMRTVNPRVHDPSRSRFWEVAPAGFHDVLETNATGTFLVARRCCRQC